MYQGFYMFQLTQPQTPLRDAITHAYRLDEVQAVKTLLTNLQFTPEQQDNIDRLARHLITQVRTDRSKSSGVDALMHEFSLSSEEGVALMCLAEALLRIPDTATRDRLIQDKLADGDWKSHLGHSPSMFVNAAAWGLVLTGKLTQPTSEQGLGSALTRVLQKGGAPFIRAGVNHAMKILGKQFVTGQTIEEALANGKARERLGYRFSFDMLGEAAMTQADADRYYQDYVAAIHAIGSDSKGRGVYDGNGISVKLSAIHPRYTRTQHKRVMNELLPRLRELFLLAKKYNIGLNIDAEESNRLELSLDLIQALICDPDLQGFDGIGFVVQAYQKRCPYVIDFLIDLARQHKQKLMIRLVKGAYWDSEIKWAQVDGMDDYPVYTRKIHTDISYLACAKKLLDAQDVIYPQFATHNAQSLASIYEMGKDKDFEFQCLHGMGETLYDQVVGEKNLNRRVRIYAPVGTHKTLLAYLVRRLLENGANSSFVNRIVDDKVSIDELVTSPINTIQTNTISTNPLTPIPLKIYGERENSKGLDLTNEHTLSALQVDMQAACQIYFDIRSVTGVPVRHLNAHPIKNPSDHNDIIGQVCFIDPNSINNVIDAAVFAQNTWQSYNAYERAKILRTFANLMQEPRRMALLMMLAVREAGKTLANAIAEIREAVDFCRYYADEAERLNLSKPIGTVVAISPWNFPLAIFVGEVVSALAAGNTVIAKPAEQTSIIAHLAVEWLHEAGIPKDALQLVLGAGDVGSVLTSNQKINGVIFTGSTEVAKIINRTLCERDDNPVLIAETGGMNAMIVDSTALAEQVCADVLTSAFDSAGQRCSALRILCIQEDVADHMIEMIKGAMNELVVDNPAKLSTDIGPVIDMQAQQNLIAHIDNLKQIAAYHEVKIQSQADQSTFVAPILFELKDLTQLTQEVFGPVLHVVRFAANQLDQLIDEINKKGYALTHGVHSRIDGTIEYIAQRIQAGNIYINRNVVGAVVGVQPFGGHAMSGTGPKAGGPFYLQRLNQLSHWSIPKTNQDAQINEKSLLVIMNALEKLNLNSQQLNELNHILADSKNRCLNQAICTLTGPTGEQNTLTWQAPKSAAIYGGNTLKSMTIAAILAMNGVRIYVDSSHPLADWAGLIDDVVTVADQNTMDNCEVILTLDDLSNTHKQRLANLDGPIRRIFHVKDTFDMTKLYHEVSQSYNTTAAGGNASLMALV